jgi:hypothetical protein
MKLTTKKLRQMIKEELDSMNEAIRDEQNFKTLPDGRRRPNADEYAMRNYMKLDPFISNRSKAKEVEKALMKRGASQRQASIGASMAEVFDDFYLEDAHRILDIPKPEEFGMSRDDYEQSLDDFETMGGYEYSRYGADKDPMDREDVRRLQKARRKGKF